MFWLCGEASAVVGWVCLVWTERGLRGPSAPRATEAWIRCERGRSDRLLTADTTQGVEHGLDRCLHVFVYAGNLFGARKHLPDRV
jgi:hypothetical protein